MDDIGDPEIPAEFDFIAGYAPFENVRVGDRYPAVLLMAGTKDDLCLRGIVIRWLLRCSMRREAMWIRRLLV